MGNTCHSHQRAATNESRQGDASFNSPPEKTIDTNIAYRPGESDLIDSLLSTCTNADLIDRLLGCAYGQALGDAYGLATEFENRERVAQNYPSRSKLIPFPNYKRTAHSSRWTGGDWTDDTDQWILILETILEGNADERVFAKKLTHWIRHGFPDLGDQGGMGLGANVQQVVYSPGYLDQPLEASRKVWERGNRQAAPNGAVMRCSAVALFYYNDLEKLKSTTISMCKTTHYDPRCITSCLAVCLTIARLWENKTNNTDLEPLIRHVQDETIQILQGEFPQDQLEAFLWHTDRERTLEDLKLDEPQKIGYTYKCLASGFYGLRSNRPFDQTLNDLIRYGGDADTNGAVCGSMYGARHGYRALPKPWLGAMPYKKWFDKKIINCLQQMNLVNTETVSTSM